MKLQRPLVDRVGTCRNSRRRWRDGIGQLAGGKLETVAGPRKEHMRTVSTTSLSPPSCLKRSVGSEVRLLMDVNIIEKKRCACSRSKNNLGLFFSVGGSRTEKRMCTQGRSSDERGAMFSDFLSSTTNPIGLQKGGITVQNDWPAK